MVISKKQVVLFGIQMFLCLIFLGVVFPNPASADQLLNMIPADSLCCVRLNNISQSLSAVDSYITGISPVGLNMLLQAQLGQMLGNPELKGLNLNGSAAVFYDPPGDVVEDDKGIAIIVPITNFNELVSSSPALTAQGNIATVENHTAIIPLGNNYVLVGPYTNIDGLITTANAIVNRSIPMLSTKLDSDEISAAEKNALWIYGDVQGAAKIFGPMILEAFEEGKKEIAENIESEDIPFTFDIEGIFDMYGSMLETFMEETKSVSVSLKPSSDVMRLECVVKAVEGTDMAKMFSAPANGIENQLLGYLENGAALNMAMDMSPGSWESFMDWEMELLSMLVGEEISDEDAADLHKMMEVWTEGVGGTAAISMGINPGKQPPFEVKYVFSMKDKAKIQESFETEAKMFTDGILGEIYSGMGMNFEYSYEKNIDSYRGASIDGLTFSMELADDDSDQANIIKLMYGDGFKAKVAYVDDLCLMALSADSDALIREMIDQVKAGGSQPGSEIREAVGIFSNVDDDIEFLMTMNMPRLMQMGMSMLPIPMPITDLPTKSNIIVGAWSGQNKVVMEMALPKAHLMEIIQLIAMIQQQEQQIRMEQENM